MGGDNRFRIGFFGDVRREQAGATLFERVVETGSLVLSGRRDGGTPLFGFAVCHPTGNPEHCGWPNRGGVLRTADRCRPGYDRDQFQRTISRAQRSWTSRRRGDAGILLPCDGGG